LTVTGSLSTAFSSFTVDGSGNASAKSLTTATSLNLMNGWSLYIDSSSGDLIITNSNTLGSQPVAIHFVLDGSMFINGNIGSSSATNSGFATAGSVAGPSVDGTDVALVQSIANGGDSFAVGQGAQASAPGSMAIGASSIAAGGECIALGVYATAAGLNTVAIGCGEALGTSSVIIAAIDQSMALTPPINSVHHSVMIIATNGITLDPGTNNVTIARGKIVATDFTGNGVGLTNLPTGAIVSPNWATNTAAGIAAAGGDTNSPNAYVKTNATAALQIPITSSAAGVYSWVAINWVTNTAAGIAAAGGDTNSPNAYVKTNATAALQIPITSSAAGVYSWVAINWPTNTAAGMQAYLSLGNLPPVNEPTNTAGTNFNSTIVATNFTGNGVGLTNLVGLIVTNSPDSYLTLGVTRTTGAAGFLSATFQFTNAQNLQLTNLTSHIPAMGGAPPSGTMTLTGQVTMLILCNSNDTVLATNVGSAANVSLLHSYYQVIK
jgi:hypothetical protein